MKQRKICISLAAGVLALLMLFSTGMEFAPNASAATSSEIKKQINELKNQKKDIQAQIDALEKQLSDNLTEMEAIVAQKNAIDQEVALLHEQVGNINDQIMAYNVLIADKQEELDDAKERLETLNAKNKERIRAMEEGGSLSYWSVLFQANSFFDLLDRLNMVQEINEADTRRLKEMNQAAEAVAAAQEALVLEKAELETTKAELAASEEELNVKREDADALLQELRAKGEEFEALIDAGEDQQADLLAQIAKKESEYTEAQRKEWLAYIATATTAPPPTQNASSSSGGTAGTGNTVNGVTWLVPVNYNDFTSPYGWRIHPVYGTKKFHYGVDLSAPQGTPIIASRSGVVTTATWDSGGGNYIIINHGDGFSSVYMHMTHYIVKRGDAVSAGQVVGYVGSTGLSTGPHLHFSITLHGQYVNPALYIDI